jgi:hypothetical protein
MDGWIDGPASAVVAAFGWNGPTGMAEHGHGVVDVDWFAAEGPIGAADLAGGDGFGLVSEDVAGEPAGVRGWGAFLWQGFEPEAEQVRQGDAAEEGSGHGGGGPRDPAEGLWLEGFPLLLALGEVDQVEDQGEAGEQAGPFGRGLADDGGQGGVDLEALGERAEGAPDGLGVIVEVGWSEVALGSDCGLQLDQGGMEGAIGASRIDREREVVIGADLGRARVYGEEALEQAIVDQILGHAGEAAGLDVARDDHGPVGDVDVPALDAVDPVRPAVVAFEPKGSACAA